jgi:hypothetical protein
MILGLSTSTFTSAHVALSLIGIVSGVIVLYGMVRATRLDGWTALFLVDRRTANPIARLRPIPNTDRFELFYWSNDKGRCTTFGNLGRMKLMLESAHEIVENDPMFRVPRSR